MNRLRSISWEVFFVAPIVLALILVGIWLVAGAAYENYRLSKSAGQILQVVALSREMKIPKNASMKRVVESFIYRMQTIAGIPVFTTKSAFLNEPAQKGFMNPWGKPVIVYFYPKAGSVRLEATLSASACRRLLLLYADTAGELGLRRVDVRNEDAMNLWQNLYNIGKQKEKAVINEPDIYAGCGKEGDLILSLSFDL